LRLLRRVAAVQAPGGHPDEILEGDPAHPGEVHCRDCEKISQAPAPFHVIARGWAGPSLLAMVLFEKFGQHSPVPGPAAKNDLIITRRYDRNQASPNFAPQLRWGASEEER
jgi:hypothetical protein